MVTREEDVKKSGASALSISLTNDSRWADNPETLGVFFFFDKYTVDCIREAVSTRSGTRGDVGYGQLYRRFGDFDYTDRQNMKTGMSSEYHTRKQRGTGRERRERRKRRDSNRMEEGDM